MKILLLFLTFSISINAQWLWGVGYQIKSSVPDKGFAVYLANKLPYQFPDIGVNVKGKFNYLSSDEITLTSGILRTDKFSEYSAGVSLEANFFTGLFQPFTGIGFGGGYLLSGDSEKYFGILSAQAGIKFAFSFQPFIEVQIRRVIPGYSDFNGIEIKKIQISGVLGVMLNL
jgi:hypothetical protein